MVDYPWGRTKPEVRASVLKQRIASAEEEIREIVAAARREIALATEKRRAARTELEKVNAYLTKGGILETPMNKGGRKVAVTDHDIDRLLRGLEIQALQSERE